MSAVLFDDPAPVAHHIAGRRQLLGPLQPLHNPANGQIARWVHQAEGPQIVQALDSAQAVQPAWAGTAARLPILRRLHGLMEAAREPLAAMLCAEAGKTLPEAQSEVARSLALLAEAAAPPPQGEHRAEPGEDRWTLDEPLGVVGVATPFAEPLVSSMALVPMALACGNAVVWKPSPQAPSTSLWLAEALLAAGAPPGLLQVLQGGPEVAQGLLHHPQVAAFAVSGTRASANAAQARAAELGKPVLAQGNPSNHLVLMPDADLDTALPLLLRAAYGCAGQQAMAASVLVLVGSVGDALLPRLAEAAQQLRIGNPAREGVALGPLISAEAKARVEALIDSGARDGAQLLLDGRGVQVAGHLGGHYLGATLFDHVQPWMQLYQRERLGPVLCCLRVANLDAALQLLQEQPEAQAACLFTRDGAAARRFAQAAPVARVGINVATPAAMEPAVLRRFFTRHKAVRQRW